MLFISKNEWQSFPAPQLPHNCKMSFYEILIEVYKAYLNLLNSNTDVESEDTIKLNSTSSRSTRVSRHSAFKNNLSSQRTLESYKLRFCLYCDETFLFDSEDMEKSLEKFDLHLIKW